MIYGSLYTLDHFINYFYSRIREKVGYKYSILPWNNPMHSPGAKC